MSSSSHSFSSLNPAPIFSSTGRQNEFNFELKTFESLGATERSFAGAQLEIASLQTQTQQLHGRLAETSAMTVSERVLDGLRGQVDNHERRLQRLEAAVRNGLEEMRNQMQPLQEILGRIQSLGMNGAILTKPRASDIDVKVNLPSGNEFRMPPLSGPGVSERLSSTRLPTHPQLVPSSSHTLLPPSDSPSTSPSTQSSTENLETRRQPPTSESKPQNPKATAKEPSTPQAAAEPELEPEKQQQQPPKFVPWTEMAKKRFPKTITYLKWREKKRVNSFAQELFEKSFPGDGVKFTDSKSQHVLLPESLEAPFIKQFEEWMMGGEFQHITSSGPLPFPLPSKSSEESLTTAQPKNAPLEQERRFKTRQNSKRASLDEESIQVPTSKRRRSSAEEKKEIRAMAEVLEFVTSDSEPSNKDRTQGSTASRRQSAPLPQKSDGDSRNSPPPALSVTKSWSSSTTELNGDVKPSLVLVPTTKICKECKTTVSSKFVTHPHDGGSTLLCITCFRTKQWKSSSSFSASKRVPGNWVSFDSHAGEGKQSSTGHSKNVEGVRRSDSTSSRTTEPPAELSRQLWPSSAVQPVPAVIPPLATMNHLPLNPTPLYPEPPVVIKSESQTSHGHNNFSRMDSPVTFVVDGFPYVE
ncbi:hypothetical protein HDU97_000698 [Phlyctochytrium planicorne]|nr:hypothetical protein HDU97_000698 [Phlyctochytrium planicorne]